MPLGIQWFKPINKLAAEHKVGEDMLQNMCKIISLSTVFIRRRDDMHNYIVRGNAAVNTTLDICIFLS